ncbi:unnamed protein product [Symbiodinium sp. CCMP2592]|nr:unnamed protein product [Symbiodinium sp. CCMP2592]
MFLQPRAKAVPRPSALVGPRSLEVPWPSKLCAARRSVPTPLELFERLADKLGVPTGLRYGRYLLACYWAMPTGKCNPEAVDWSDLVALALVVEHAPVDTDDVKRCLLLTEERLVYHWDVKKIGRIIHAWSIYRRAT